MGVSYIASQAPIPSTFGEFWRMIWQEKVSTIVSLVKVERNRVIRYGWMNGLIVSVKCIGRAVLGRLPSMGWLGFDLRVKPPQMPHSSSESLA